MLNEKQLAELARLAKDATPGPWCICDGDLCRHDCPNGDPENCTYQCEECLITSHEDKMFIAAARDAVPLLIEEIRKLQKECKELCGQNGKLQHEHLEIGLEAGRLRHRIEQLDKEADWLACRASKLWGCVKPENMGTAVCAGKLPPEVTADDCINCWRKQAQKVAMGACHD